MNRVDFQNLATERLSDAEALIAGGRFDCAYYVAGYAVECALKACILFQASWMIVEDWSESSRYENNKDRLQAESMVDAIKNPQNGVLQWLKNFW
jgi:hypothetical protein